MALKSLKSVVVASLITGGLIAVAPAVAHDCSGKTTPPSDYTARGTTTRPPSPFNWIAIQQGITSGDRFIGAYYADGYVYADASNTSAVTLRTFVPWWPGYVDTKITVGSTNQCAHVQQIAGDGCYALAADPCTFVGSGSIGAIATANAGPWSVYHFSNGVQVVDASGSGPFGAPKTWAAGVTYHVTTTNGVAYAGWAK